MVAGTQCIAPRRPATWHPHDSTRRKSTAQWNVLQPTSMRCAPRQSRLIDPTDVTRRSERHRASRRPNRGSRGGVPLGDGPDRQVDGKRGGRTRSARLRSCALAIAGVVVMLAGGTRLVRRSTGDAHDSSPGRQFGIPRRPTDARTCRCTGFAAASRSTSAKRSKSKNRALAAQLSHADRVASMGHLTIGLAHELNQPLGAIANYAEGCDVILSQPPESRGHGTASRKH